MADQAAIDILYVEDDQNDVELTLRALKRQGITNPLHHARDGVEALEYLYGPEAAARARPGPRLILLDAKLPRVSGFEVLKRVREEQRTRGVPVVILTSSRERHDIERAYALGANSYVVKPVDFDRFEAAVGRIGRYWLHLNELPRA